MRYFSRLLMLFALFPFFCSGQGDIGPTTKQNHRSFFMFSIGKSIPENDLADQAPSNNTAGLATAGLDVRLLGGSQVSKHLGFCASYFNQTFKMNTQVMADYLNSRIPGTTSTVDLTKPWNLSGLVVGFYGCLPLGESETFVLEPRIMFGFAGAQSPDFNVTATSNYTTGVQVVVRQFSSNSQIVGAYLFGCSLKIETTKHFLVALNVDYTGLTTSTEFTNVKIESSNGSPSTTNFTTNMSSFALSFGIGFRFGK